MKSKIYLLLLLVLSSCSAEKVKVTINPTFPKIINNICCPDTLERRMAFVPEYVDAQVYYCGPIESKVVFKEKEYNLGCDFVTVSHEELIENNKDNELKIEIDLNQTLTEREYLFNKESRKIDTMNYESIPICIYNLNVEDYILDHFHHIPLEVQVQIDSVWMCLRANVCADRYVCCCFPEFNGLIIPSNNMICTKIPKYTGEHEVKLRVKFDKYISSEFMGGLSSFQYNQLKSKYEMQKQNE